MSPSCKRYLPFAVVAFSLLINALASNVKLWVSGSCPYAARAWIACKECVCSDPSIPFELRMVDLSDKPADFNDLYSSISPDSSARSKVPILEDGDFRMIESAVIARYVIRKYGSESLGGPEEVAKADLFAETFQNTLGSLNRKILMAAGDADAIAGLDAELKTSVQVLETFFNKHVSSGPFVNGVKFSLAEALCGPFIQRLIPAAQHYAQMDVLETCKQQNAEKLLAWISATLNRPSVADIKVPDDDLISGYDKMLERIKASATK